MKTAPLTYALWLSCLIGSLAFAEDPTVGRELYKVAGGYGCGVCHGPVANGGGQAGGPIRGATREQFDKALAEQPTMKLLVNALDEQNLSDLSSYLMLLADMPLVELTFDDVSWTITQAPINQDQIVQFVLFNDGFSDLQVDLTGFGLDEVTIAPMDTAIVEWVAVAGSYFLPDDSLLVVSDQAVCVH
jgi:cytochrome c553